MGTLETNPEVYIEISETGYLIMTDDMTKFVVFEGVENGKNTNVSRIR